MKKVFDSSLSLRERKEEVRGKEFVNSNFKKMNLKINTLEY